jgi:NAD(P)-dependent dehydrogenase (short-subunit alcohol dehydrogenase family)
MTAGSVVAIAGAGGTLGPSVVRAFAAAGASLALAGRDGRKLLALGAGIPPDRLLFTSIDLLDASAAAEWVREIFARFGRVDVVIHLVGGYRGGSSIGEIDPADWTAMQNMLVVTTLNVARAFAGPLAKSGRGRFIAVTSPKAREPTARSALYAMAKAASDALVRALADELRGTGATANLLEVDSIDAPESRAGAPKKAAGKTTPAEAIAAAMLSLCSDEAAAINGARIPLTGRA